jgi:hypothetical protein
VAVIFSENRGVVTSVQDPAAPAQMLFNLENWEGFNKFHSIITGVTVTTQGNFQFLHTLGGKIFVYVFGDRIGQFNIEGMAFDIPCDGEGMGIEHVMLYYSDNRIANRAEPLKITIGPDLTLRCYLVGFGAKQISTEGSRTYHFNMQFAQVPENQGNGSSTTTIPGGGTGTGSSGTTGTDVPPTSPGEL